MKYPLTVLLILGGCCTNSFAADEEGDWGVWATGVIDFSEQHQDLVDDAVEESGIGVAIDPVEEPKGVEDRLMPDDKISSFATIRGLIPTQTIVVDVVEIAGIPDEGGAEAVYGSGISGSDENLLHELDKSSLLDYETRTDNSELQSLAAEPSDLGASRQLVGAEFEDADLLE